MRPDQHEFDDEIRGHMALSVKEAIERGDDPEAARLAALREFGNVTLTRESMQAVWRSRWFEMADALRQDIRVALRSLGREKGLAATIAVTLALGIGANAAIFSVVRQVLFSPLVNRDEDRLIYIRQSAPGLGADNTTFSMPEIGDLREGATTISGFGDFSTVDLTLIGFGEPRVVKAGVVGGSYFDVMGLRPVLGRLLDAGDDGPDAAGAAVLTHRFWSASLDRDPSVIGKTVRLGSRSATIVGVLEPSVPYPADTEIIANIVTSPHHLGATMVTERTHRMTELFGRLAPGASVEAARAELTAAHAAMMRRHPEAYSAGANVRLSVTSLREQITAPARPILLVLLGAAGLVFAIACSNVANLILARTVRRERELAVRAALGAGTGALRRTLLAESLVLCGSGAALGLLLARPLVTAVGHYAARFTVRALDVTLDASLLWIGAGLAMVAAVVLAYVPRLPSPHAPNGLGLACGGLRITPGTNRRLRMFAVTQIALSFVLLTGAGMLLVAFVRLQAEDVTPGFFAALGVPIVAGRDFTDEDQRGSELVVIVSQSVARRMFANGEALNGHFWWTEPLFGDPEPRRIVGVAADVDDEHVVPNPTLTIYHPLEQVPGGGRLFVQAASDPYALVTPVTRIIREISAEQPVERAATLADVRAAALAPERLNAFVLSGFAGVALLIAVVGVAGVLAFSVSARTREFGVRLAVGSTPQHLRLRVVSEGAVIVAIGIGAGAAAGYAFGRAAASYFGNETLPGALPILGAAIALAGAAVVASLLPAVRAFRVDVLEALRPE